LEETVLTIRKTSRGVKMEVTARVLLHEIKGFAIAGEMNFMPVLLQIMPE